MSKPYNVTNSNIEVFENLEKRKQELESGVRVILSEGDTTGEIPCYLVFVMVCAAYVYILEHAPKTCHNEVFILGCGIFVSVFLYAVMYVKTAVVIFLRMVKLLEVSKGMHKEMVVEMNVERLRMVEGSPGPEVSDYQRVWMEWRVDFICECVYRRLDRAVGAGILYQTVVVVCIAVFVLCCLYLMLVWQVGR